MLVAPLLQLSLVFRFLFAFILNPHHEVFGQLVIFGTVVSILGACAIAIDTNVILDALAVPEHSARSCARLRDLSRTFDGCPAWPLSPKALSAQESVRSDTQQLNVAAVRPRGLQRAHTIDVYWMTITRAAWRSAHP